MSPSLKKFRSFRPQVIQNTASKEYKGGILIEAFRLTEESKCRISPEVFRNS